MPCTQAFPCLQAASSAADACWSLLQADRHHILAAVISCSPTAQGGRYLQRHLQRVLQHQLKQHGGNAQAALPATLHALDEAFRDMHPFNGHVCEGVKLTLAYIDAKTKVRLTPPLYSLQALEHLQRSPLGLCHSLQSRLVRGDSLCGSCATRLTECSALLRTSP